MRGYLAFGAISAVATALALFGREPAFATETPPAADAPLAQASPGSDAAKIRELQKRIDQRDAVIRDLMRRVERLEHDQATRGTAGSASVPTASSQGAKKLSPSTASGQAPPVAAAPGTTRTAATTQTPTAQAAPAPAQAPPDSSQPAKPGPGQFDVSEEAAQHALERALVQTGAALLPSGTLEFVPSLTYQYQRLSVPGQIALTSGGSILITENLTQSNQVQANALLRAGLPWGMQAEIGVPWDYKRLTVASRANGAGLSEQAIDVQGLGDPSISLTKQILSESDLRPGLFLSGGWNSNLGQVKHKLPLGTGFNEVLAGFTAVKRQDPLVFTGGFTYEKSLEHNGLKPGDQYIANLAMLLAVSPETSLRFNQQITFGNQSTFRGKPIPGSEKTAGTFSFGLLSILGRGFVVDFTAGIGETPDAPNFFIQLGFPIRLN